MINLSIYNNLHVHTLFKNPLPPSVLALVRSDKVAPLHDIVPKQLQREVCQQTGTSRCN